MGDHIEEVWPEEVLSNAWHGEAAVGKVADSAAKWGAKRDTEFPSRPLAAEEIDYTNWRDGRVGWGVVLPFRDGWSRDDLAIGADAPEPIRQLIAARDNAPIFRYVPSLGSGVLRRILPDGKESDLSFDGARGIGPIAVPWYLLIVGSPKEIPWGVQYQLQTNAFVGRLDLDATGLENYVSALLSDWGGSDRNVATPVVWTVDKGHPDITRLMRKTITDRIVDCFRVDKEFDISGSGYLTDGSASVKALADALGERRPAFVVTSSHGSTSPLENAAEMAKQLGGLVDQQGAVLANPSAYALAPPAGSIWYSHACCSAGCNDRSAFDGIFEAGSTLDVVLKDIANIGALTAPLPRALLGAKRPIGAFVGHVEPTFDRTLRWPSTGQVTAHDIVGALYNKLHLAKRPPIGYAMKTYYQGVAGLLLQYSQDLDALANLGKKGLSRAFDARFIALDRLAMVLLGDPTVRLPLPSN
ncbi:hypothetical protein ACG02S_26000 [Roseateles sp. DC23W]|uniref:Peptidase family C25 n=1 Tax=Pelomonas dachongensis TaxID=3299029 RepID=A0ABW7EVG4_9BURK